MNLAVCVRDRSGKPAAKRGLAANSPTARFAWARPNKNTNTLAKEHKLPIRIYLYLPAFEDKQ